ncbi:MAG: hypothetical protein ACI9CU_001357, partial [Polaribacter sp.]
MKSLFTTILAVAILCPFFGYAQAPEMFNYQGVARNADGKVLSNQEISLRIGILSAVNMDRAVYAEEHAIKTNNFGLFSIQIGNGEALEGEISKVDWESSAHYVAIQLDADNSGNFLEMGTSQLLSVPYALYAKRSGTEQNTSAGTNRSDPNDWTINGNTGTDAATNFLGTTDAQDLVFKTNNQEAGRFNQTGQLALPIGSDIIIGGANALNMDGTRNIHIGQNAGAISTGDQNAFIGYNAGQLNTTGAKNTFIGPTA